MGRGLFTQIRVRRLKLLILPLQFYSTLNSNERGEGNAARACKLSSLQRKKIRIVPMFESSKSAWAIIACCTVYPSDVGVNDDQHSTPTNFVRSQVEGATANNNTRHICLNPPSQNVIFRRTRFSVSQSGIQKQYRAQLPHFRILLGL